MGSGNSHLQQQQPMIDHQGLPAIMGGHDPATALISYQQQQQQPQYPDMNQIFKGIPKMMQVADDMHRMTNYMQDLRNLMYFCTAFCALGILLFLLLRFMQNRKSTQRRRRPHNNPRTDDSEQSSLSISRPNFRHYQSARPVDNWTHKIEMDRMIDSTSTRHTNMTHHGTQGGGSGSVHGPGHGLVLNSKAALLNSPEHQHHQQQQHHPHYNNASPDPQSSTCLQQQPPPQIGRSQTATPTPTPTAGPQQPPFLHHPTAQHHHPTQPQQANGQLKQTSSSTAHFKRLDPVKLVVDEMPYVDHNEQEDEQ